MQRAVLVGAPLVMSLALPLYQDGWVRFFAPGRGYALLFERLLGVPIPLAISPTLYFLAVSFVLGSWCLALATVILGVGHLWVGLRQSRKVLD